MTPGRESRSDAMRYRGTFSCDRAGRYGFTVRVVPCHPLVVTPVELGRVAWA
jgi:starch phosphorylase